MRVAGLVLRWFLGIVLVVLAGAAGFLYVSPPELLKVADAYTAKIVCSNVFLADRDPQVVLADDVQAPGNPILKFIRLSVNRDDKTITARLLGFIAPQTAIFRPGYGCTSIPDGKVDASLAVQLPKQAELPEPGNGDWPQGSGGVSVQNEKLTAVLDDANNLGPGFRAVVVIKDGKLIGEKYQSGFTAKTPLLGWSMTKTVNAAVIGRMMALGKIPNDEKGLFKEWAGDSRKDIALSDMLAMQSGLKFEESYGDVNDVTRTLYLEPDMAAFNSAKPSDAPTGTKFVYSTGTAVLLAKYWMNHFEDRAEALLFPRKELFGLLGMTSATFEVDESGTFVGGSYLYANARDWARFGQFLLQDGQWNGTRLLPEGFVTKMRTPNSKSDGQYSQAQTWIQGPGERPNSEFGVPDDTFYALGHDGQSISIVPSQNLVVVRLGLTPGKLEYRPQVLLKNIIAALN